MGLFIDFYDSFSANILHYLKKTGMNVDHVYWDDMSVHSLMTSERYSYLILGPGPGHYSDYSHLMIYLEDIVRIREKKIVGVCLGHQILGVLYGLELFQLKKPLHGKRLDVLLEDHHPTKFSAQFYNSWALKPTDLDLCKHRVEELNGEQAVIFLQGENFLSYQFHPESIGTSCPDIIFNRIENFLYN